MSSPASDTLLLQHPLGQHTYSHKPLTMSVSCNFKAPAIQLGNFGSNFYADRLFSEPK